MSSEQAKEAQMANAAASWWRKAIERPKFDALGNTQRDAHMEMASMMAMLLVKPTTDVALDAFEANLAHTIYNERPRNLGVDYHPDIELERCATAQGMDGSRFPWKTMMWFNWQEGTVKVRHGYGAEVQQIFPPESKEPSHG